MTAKPTKTAIVQQIAPTKTLQVIETPEINRHPSPRLGTAAEVRMKMARLYRDARTGQVEITDATKLAYILTQLRIPRHSATQSIGIRPLVPR